MTGAALVVLSPHHPEPGRPRLGLRAHQAELRHIFAAALQEGLMPAYPVLGEDPSKISPFKAKMDLSVLAKNAPWKMRDILRRHWLAVGARHGVIAEDGRPAASVVDDLVARTPEVVTAVRQLLPQDFPLPLADSILGGLQDAANRLAA